ncbi:PfkB family carbohydrate kinase [Streptomyces sp. 8L]|uniref:PfkB family carbohydrate kinase n=1 Tax=Streptomyces sp. 8L TaxID=2877242 RepID=UPI001CD435B7|nr:PfkB family carbohydrate kinase [Streptomyces sp. 8L]MCA1219505.1 PfkB family carbohydrate kinase [Streptomyces sp. 8L]
MNQAPPPGAVLVLGEALIDLVPYEDGPGTARRYAAEPGGAPVNVAVGLARLATPSWFAGALGGDAFAADLERTLTAAGVDLSLTARSGLPTTLAVTDPRSDGTGYHFHLAGTATFQITELADRAGEFAAVYAGGLAAVVGAAAAAGAAAARSAARTSVLMVDPNVRTDRSLDPAASAERLRELCRCAHVVKVSDEDLAALWPDRTAEDACADLAAGGRLTLLTRGADGSVAFTPDGERVAVPATPVTVVNTIGAGDAFAAGVLHRITALAPPPGGPVRVTREQAADILAFAGRAAASVVASSGTALSAPVPMPR